MVKEPQNDVRLGGLWFGLGQRLVCLDFETSKLKLGLNRLIPTQPNPYGKPVRIYIYFLNYPQAHLFLSSSSPLSAENIISHVRSSSARVRSTIRTKQNPRRTEKPIHLSISLSFFDLNRFRYVWSISPLIYAKVVVFPFQIDELGHKIGLGYCWNCISLNFSLSRSFAIEN